MTDDVLEMLKESVSSFAAVERERQKDMASAADGAGLRSWQEIAEQGWIAAAISEESGGLGLGVRAAAVIAREFGRAALKAPFVASGVLAPLCLDGQAGQHGSFGDLIGGGRVAALAAYGSGDVTHGPSGVHAEPVGNGVRLSGEVRFVTPATATAFIVGAAQGDDFSLWWVSDADPGFSRKIERGADGSAIAHIAFEQVELGDDRRLASGQSARIALNHATDAALIASAAELLGIMDGALAMTLDYLRERKQFGVAIGSFQALQHRAVDIWIQRQITEAAVFAAARAFDDPATQPARRSALASGAKSRASQAAMQLCNQALQLHGAIGFAEEYGLGHFINRALAVSAWLGNAVPHRHRFAMLIEPDQRGQRVAS